MRGICAKTIHPCIVLATSFGKAETSLLIKPAASVPLLNILNVSKIRLRYFFALFLVSTPSISKGLRKSFFQNGQGCPWFHAEATFCAMHKSRRQNAQGWAGNKSETSFGTRLVLYRCTWTYIGREVHGCTLLDRLFQKAYGGVCFTICCC